MKVGTVRDAHPPLSSTAVVAVVFLVGCGRIGFQDLDDGSSDAGGDRDSGSVGDIDADITTTTANIMFVTSTTHTLNMGVPAADAICQARAAAGGLPGTYVAFLSTAAQAARDRLGTARGWVRVDGRVFADDVTSLFAGAIYHPPSLDELGQRLPDNAFVVTGSNALGRLGDASCADWSTAGGARGGNPHAGMSWWVTQFVLTCTGAHIYCFGIDRTTALTPPAPAGRRAFVAPGFTSRGGIASADALCTSEATAAGLPGSYRALLATETASAASRFDIGTWHRVDGARFTTDLITLDSPLRVTASGAQLTSLVWTGSASPFNLASGADSCNSWTATGGNGIVGSNELATSRTFTTSTQESCSAPFAIYCLET